eukprot:8453943-Ditylum_brightwellii.AAC.1
MQEIQGCRHCRHQTPLAHFQGCKKYHKKKEPDKVKRQNLQHLKESRRHGEQDSPWTGKR